MTKKVPERKGSKRPADSPHVQQHLAAWPGEISANTYGAIFIILAIMFIPIGTTSLNNSNNIYEYRISYDSGAGSSCSISNANEGKVCQATFQFTEDVSGPLYLYYELKNYYQNHRRYYLSYDASQLMGQVMTESDVSLSCDPYYKNGSLLLNPCGLVAASFFNDQFSINTTGSSSANLILDDSDIALSSDRDTLYKQVTGFQSYSFNSSVSSSEASAISCESVGLNANCKTYTNPKTGISSKFFYPNDDSTQYLYEMFPNQISPLDGVTDQHFIVWMRTAMFPTFRKLYGKIEGNFKSGDSLVIDIVANYEVDSYDAEKSILISTLGNYGGKNIFIGQLYITIGSIFLAFGVAVLVREQLRKL
jgi:hypothetical protein